MSPRFGTDRYRTRSVTGGLAQVTSVASSLSMSFIMMTYETPAELDALWVRSNAGYDTEKCAAFEEYVRLSEEIHERLGEGEDPVSLELTTLKIRNAQLLEFLSTREAD